MLKEEYAEEELPLSKDGNNHDRDQNIIIQFEKLSLQQSEDRRNNNSSSATCIWQSSVFHNKSRFSRLSTSCKKKRAILNRI